MKNTAPFLVNDKDRSFVRLSKLIYSEKAILLFKEECCNDGDFSVSDKGDYFFLEAKGVTEEDCLDALNYLLYLLKKTSRATV